MRHIAIPFAGRSTPGVRHAAALLFLISLRGWAQPLCDSLPESIAQRLKADYAAWKIVEPTDLDPYAHARWNQEKPLQCPGVATGRFHEGGELETAVLLIHKTSTEHSYKLLLFTLAKSAQPGIQELDSFENLPERELFIRTVALNSEFDAPSRRKFKIRASEGILLGAAAKSEYEIDIYYFADGRFQASSVDR